MKTDIEVHHYMWDQSFEVHVYVQGKEHLLVLFEEYNPDTMRWEIHHENDYNEIYRVPNLTVLSDEELFQLSLVWDTPLDFYVVKAIQEHVISTQQTWSSDTCYNHVLEY